MGKRKIITRWSQYHLPSTIFFICTILSCFCLLQGSARDTITVNDWLSNNDTLVSDGERFELGFFSPSKISANQYVGIWYYKSTPRIIVWVANRDSPIREDNESVVLAIKADGNLKLVGETSGTVYFNTEVKSSQSTHRVAKLMDSGNLVLRDNQSNQSATSLWESFKKPTDTFLAGMQMDTGLLLTSWCSQHDPKTGNFTFGLTTDQGVNQFQIQKNILTYWRGAEYDEVLNSDEIIPNQIVSLLSNFSPRIKPTNGSIYSKPDIPTIDYNSTRLVMNVTGEIQFWKEDKGKVWSLIWKEPTDRCSVFHYCGRFGICNSNHELKCNCLPGFVPQSLENWKSGEFSDGCETKSRSCGGNFVKLKVTKLGRTQTKKQLPNVTKCFEECRQQCRCQAYSFEVPSSRRGFNGFGTCRIWTDDLYDLQKDITNGNLVIYVRAVASDIESGSNTSAGGGNAKEGQDEALNGRKKEWALIVGVTTACVLILSCTIIYFYIRRKKATNQDRTILRPDMACHLYDRERHVKDMVDPGEFKEEDKQRIDLPFFDFENILAATDNFSETNKLGKGGFGPVYKGKFSRGQEMAVKRLSSVSGQGMEEFKNEVVLIARLQHRNLVRLLGYCIERSEKILLYEYMPNKSLDLFLFDGKLSMLLDWEMRFNIILGIARGLLYLHQDSRLRIIHRDLKTSNVLLDQEMNPKISDFGLARIFEGKQTEGTTNRVVGTYGYMSPEYALDGFFSVKSDVFSFGVVVLEIISGKKNTGFYDSEEALSLLGYAWRLWQNNRALDIMDEKVRESSKTNEILKCINVGLLCVQENPNDRPTMSNILVMLGSDAAALPVPKQPAFVIRGGPCSMGTESSSTKLASNAELTITLEAR